MAKQAETVGHSQLVDGSSTTLHTHPGGGADYDFLRFLRTGRYHFGQPQSANTTQALTANRLYANPFITPVARTITRIAVQVTTAGTGNARLGIYQDGGATYPGSLVIDAGEVSIASTGLKTITGLNITLQANTLYWLVLVSNGTPTVSAITAANAFPILGNADTALSAAGYSSWYVSFTYAILPATYPGSATANNGNLLKVGVYF